MSRAEIARQGLDGHPGCGYGLTPSMMATFFVVLGSVLKVVEPVYALKDV